MAGSVGPCRTQDNLENRIPSRRHRRQVFGTDTIAYKELGSMG